MRALILAALAGAAVAAGITYLLMGGHTAPAPMPDTKVVRDIVEVPKITFVEAEEHRKDRFQGIQTIEDTLALPSDFLQTESLYVLAGRSDSAGVQDLIHQANRIVDLGDRRGALSILFGRLAELDPMSALALARSGMFSSGNDLEATVWRDWAEFDLDAALAAASALQDPTRRNRAAQALFAAHGYMGNATAIRIEEELGIRPDQRVRSQFIYRMAEESPQGAIDYISNMPYSRERYESINWVANYLARQDPDNAAGYVDLFPNGEHRKQYLATVQNAIAQSDPEQAIQQILSMDPASRRDGRGAMVFHSLARRDIDRALEFYGELDSHNDKRALASAIAQELAVQDPHRAFEWAREVDPSGQQHILMNVLVSVAGRDPDLAFNEAMSIENVQQKQGALQFIINNLAERDLPTAISYMDRLSDPTLINAVAGNIVTQWAMQDPAAAMDWVLNNPKLNNESVLPSMAHRIANTDVDTAMRILPRIKGESTVATWQAAIMQQLVQSGSFDQAESFIRQQETTDNHANLQTMLVQHMAMVDVNRARRIADQQPYGAKRDASYAALVGAHARVDPRQAARWLDEISDANHRQTAMSQLAQHWYRSEPEAATRWVRNLAKGPARDQVIARLAYSWPNPTPSQKQLVDSIGDPQLKAQVEQVIERNRVNRRGYFD